MLPVKGFKELPNNIVNIDNRAKVLRSAVIYGANASGKSNVLKALTEFIDFIINSTDNKLNDPVGLYDPFLLNKASGNRPAEFNIEFLLNKVRYVYNISCNGESILSEHLSYYPKGQVVRIYDRENITEFKYGTILKGEKKSIENRLLNNQLYLTKAANENLEFLVDLYNYFNGFNAVLNRISGMSEYISMGTVIGSVLKEEGDVYLKKFENIITAFDVGIQSVKIRKNTRDKSLASLLPEGAFTHISSNLLTKEIPELEYEIVTVHKLLNEKSDVIEYVEFTLDKESAGTKNLFTLALLLLEHFKAGSAMIIDEFEKSLHPQIVQKLVQLFHDPDLNINNAQLIFSTHAINLLDNNLFRRDQMWFTEKDENGVTDLYSLSQVEGVRKDVPYDKWYLSGRFGATPILYEPDINFGDDLQKGE